MTTAMNTGMRGEVIYRATRLGWAFSAAAGIYIVLAGALTLGVVLIALGFLFLLMNACLVFSQYLSDYRDKHDPEGER